MWPLTQVAAELVADLGLPQFAISSENLVRIYIAFPLSSLMERVRSFDGVVQLKLECNHF